MKKKLIIVSAMCVTLFCMIGTNNQMNVTEAAVQHSAELKQNHQENISENHSQDQEKKLTLNHKTIRNSASVKAQNSASKTPENLKPIKINLNVLSNGGKVSLGDQYISAATTCTVSLKWKGNVSLTLHSALKSGKTTTYTIKNGKEFSFQIKGNNTYTIAVKNNNKETVKNLTGSISFKNENSSPQGTSKKPIKGEQTVVYNSAEILQYDNGSPYIHNVRKNNTNRKIIGHEYSMLAFDKNGKPLKLRWYFSDSSSKKTYGYLVEAESEPILPNQTNQVYGGWSLDETDPISEEIAYVLYCDKKITFEGGEVWMNKEYKKWLKTYEGKKVETKTLKNYYPYVQTITQ